MNEKKNLNFIKKIKKNKYSNTTTTTTATSLYFNVYKIKTKQKNP